jgi:hypothetical protein
MTKTRRAAALIGALCAAGGMLAACGGSHKAAAPSVVVTRPNTPAQEHIYAAPGKPLEYHGKPVTIQMMLRGEGKSDPPPLTKGQPDRYDDVTGVKYGSYYLVAGTNRVGCDPLPKPVPLASVQAAVAKHGIVDAAFLALPKAAREAITEVTSSGPQTVAQSDGLPEHNVLFLVRGVRLGSPTAKTERYRLGPTQPGQVVIDVDLHEVDGKWRSALPFIQAVTIARC